MGSFYLVLKANPINQDRAHNVCNQPYNYMLNHNDSVSWYSDSLNVRVSLYIENRNLLKTFPKSL